MTKIENDLQSVINFTAEDLKANRERDMSTRQRVVLHGKVQRLNKRLLLIIASAVIIGIIILFSDIYKNPSDRSIAFFFVMIVELCFLIYVYLKRRRYLLDLSKGTVDLVEGKLKLTYYDSRGYTSYTAKIQETWFDVSKKVFIGLKNFERVEPECIIYYAPCSRAILSVEASSKRDN